MIRETWNDRACGVCQNKRINDINSHFTFTFLSAFFRCLLNTYSLIFFIVHCNWTSTTVVLLPENNNLFLSQKNDEIRQYRNNLLQFFFLTFFDFFFAYDGRKVKCGWHIHGPKVMTYECVCFQTLSSFYCVERVSVSLRSTQDFPNYQPSACHQLVFYVPLMRTHRPIMAQKYYIKFYQLLHILCVRLLWNPDNFEWRQTLFSALFLGYFFFREEMITSRHSVNHMFF